MSDKSRVGSENDYGKLLALNGYEYHEIQIYGGQEDGATVCRIMSPTDKELHITSADDFNEALALARKWIDEHPDYAAAQNHIRMLESRNSALFAERDALKAEVATSRERISLLEKVLDNALWRFEQYDYSTMQGIMKEIRRALGKGAVNDNP